MTEPNAWQLLDWHDALREDVAWGLITELHKNVPEADRPMSWSDLSDDQKQRALDAADRAYKIIELTVLLAAAPSPPPSAAVTEEIAGALFAVDHANCTLQGEKAWAVRENLKWPTPSLEKYYRYAQAALAVAPQAHAGEGPGPSTLAASRAASPSVSRRGEPAPSPLDRATIEACAKVAEELAAADCFADGAAAVAAAIRSLT